MNKGILIVKVPTGIPTKKDRVLLESLNYKHIYILSDKEGDIQSKNISIVYTANDKEIKTAIDSIYEQHPEDIILPKIFGGRGEINTKHSIYIYNKTFGSKIPAKTFRNKDDMNTFLEDIAEKKFTQGSFDEIQAFTYKNICAHVGETGIIKPLNSSSSTLVFTFKNEEEFQYAQSHITSEFDYIIETYIPGELFSVDFFVDKDEMYLLSYVKETPFQEFIEQEYDFGGAAEYLEKNARFTMPFRYNVDRNKFSKEEKDFIENVRKKLSEIEYRGYIHLEYKFDKKTKQLGFIEWGARLGGYRSYFIKNLHHTEVDTIAHQILIEKDTSKWKEIQPNIHTFKEEHHNLNIIGFQIPFQENISFMKFMQKNARYLHQSLEVFVKIAFLKHDIEAEKIDFYMKTNPKEEFGPIHLGSTWLKYYLYVDQENYEKVLKLTKKKMAQLLLGDF